MKSEHKPLEAIEALAVLHLVLPLPVFFATFVRSSLPFRVRSESFSWRSAYSPVSSLALYLQTCCRNTCSASLVDSEIIMSSRSILITYESFDTHRLECSNEALRH